jgi:hypothetical protein
VTRLATHRLRARWPAPQRLAAKVHRHLQLSSILGLLGAVDASPIAKRMKSCSLRALHPRGAPTSLRHYRACIRWDTVRRAREHSRGICWNRLDLQTHHRRCLRRLRCPQRCPRSDQQLVIVRHCRRELSGQHAHRAGTETETLACGPSLLLAKRGCVSLASLRNEGHPGVGPALTAAVGVNRVYQCMNQYPWADQLVSLYGSTGATLSTPCLATPCSGHCAARPALLPTAAMVYKQPGRLLITRAHRQQHAPVRTASIRRPLMVLFFALCGAAGLKRR